MFKILVAEDDPSTNRLFCAILRRAGYEPVPVFDGREALEKLDEVQVDLLLCDVMMPRMDGFELTRAIRESGSMLPILMATARSLPEDKRTGFLVGTDDYITKPVDREEMLRKDFVRNFSHEFKTPITSLGGFADLLLEDEDMPAGERREYLKIISDESRRLAGLANSVLALSRVESQTILTDAKPFNLTEQLRQTVLQIQHKWAAKRPDIRLDAEECTYTGNEALLREVWVNLLDNAVKFSPEGSAVDVRLRRTQGGVTVTVTDSGPGMDDATLARAFDRFYQGDTSHRTEGNGLGLAMVKQIVSLHKGAVTAANEPGRGSTFTVTL